MTQPQFDPDSQGQFPEIEPRTVVGWVNGTTGALYHGQGFTVVRIGVGTYTIAFSPNFARTPSVAFGVYYAALVNSPVPRMFGAWSGSVVQMVLERAGVATDADWSIIAIGT